MSDNRPIQLRRVIATVELDLDPHTPQHFSCRRYGELKSGLPGSKGKWNVLLSTAQIVHQNTDDRFSPRLSKII
jgi:hypothetical protein